MSMLELVCTVRVDVSWYCNLEERSPVSTLIMTENSLDMNSENV